MPDQSVNIKIRATNGTTQTFRDISNSGEAVALSLEKAGVKGSQSFEKWTKAARDVGAVVGSVAILAAKLGGDAQAAQARIEGAFDSAGLAIADFSGQIDALAQRGLDLGFDDEDVTDSIAKLTRITGDAEKAFRDLAIAENISRGEKISLAAATEIVAATEAGRLRSMNALGIKLDENASKEDYLLEAQRRYANEAQNFAETGAASFLRYQNIAENALESVGGALQNVLPYLAAASVTASGVGTLGGLLQDTGAGAKVASVALGPAGLATAALAAGAGIVFLIESLDDYTDAADAATGATLNLDNFLTTLASGLFNPQVQASIEALNETLDQTINDAATRQSDLDKLLSVQMGITNEGISIADQNAMALAQTITDLTEDQLRWLDSNGDLRISVDEVNAAVTAFQGNLDRLNADQVSAVAKNIEFLFTRRNIDVAAAAADVQLWIDQLNSGAISGEEFAAKIDYAAVHYGDYVTAASEAAETTNAATEAITANAEAMTKQGSTLVANSTLVGHISDNYRAYIQSLNASEEALLAWSAAQVKGSSSVVANSGLMAAAQDASIRRSLYAITVEHDHAIAQGNLADAYAQTAGAIELPSRPISDMTAALDAQTEQGQRAIEMLQQYAAAVDQVPALANTAAANLAAGAAGAGAALGDAFRVAVGNTDNIGNQAGQVDDWARSLINVQGAYGKIDDLLASGAISQDDWNAAQDAGNRIFAATANIQEDVLAIQAKQAPLIADATREQEKYLDLISKMPAEQQATTLAYMDTSTAMKAQQLQALAIAAAHGELGSKGKESAASIIEGAAAADPYLKSILEDMGLITTEDGEVKINYDSVSDAKSELGDLTAVLGDLITVLEQAFNVNVTTNAGDTRAELEGVVGLLNELDGRSVTYYVNAAGNGVTVGNPNGPGIEQLAGGGMVRARLGEMGGEVVSLAGGGTAYAPTDGIYSLPSGSYVHTAPVSRHLTPGANMGGITVPITINGNVYGMDDLETQVANKLAPALEAALRERRRSKGMRVA